ncbi:unnamed protein product, partial [Coregonus sp. 'balchen']
MHDTGEPGNVTYGISVYNVIIPLGGAPNGTYWLCGKMACYSLPLNWRGTCTVEFVVTAMRTVPNNDKNLKALFRLALQNKEALDYLLAGQGGTSAIIGDECCTFLPDRYCNVTDLAEYIATVAKNNSPQPMGCSEDMVPKRGDPEEAQNHRRQEIREHHQHNVFLNLTAHVAHTMNSW